MKLRIVFYVNDNNGRSRGWFSGNVSLPVVPSVGSKIEFSKWGVESYRSRFFDGFLAVEKVIFSLGNEMPYIELQTLYLDSEDDIEPLANWMEATFRIFYDD